MNTRENQPGRMLALQVQDHTGEYCNPEKPKIMLVPLQILKISRRVPTLKWEENRPLLQSLKNGVCTKGKCY
jgi:hypothetical protein